MSFPEIISADKDKFALRSAATPGNHVTRVHGIIDQGFFHEYGSMVLCNSRLFYENSRGHIGKLKPFCGLYWTDPSLTIQNYFVQISKWWTKKLFCIGTVLSAPSIGSCWRTWKRFWKEYRWIIYCFLGGKKFAWKPFTVTRKAQYYFLHRHSRKHWQLLKHNTISAHLLYNEMFWFSGLLLSVGW